MSIFSALYSLLIEPLELFFSIIFSLAYRVLHNPGLSIIFLSLAMNFLVLPLYRQADALQAEERETEERLGHWVKHIKKTFSGDERYMILQTYYRQNNYKPSYALKGSVSLLLEIPFFIAAYNFLSGLAALDGTSFGPIADLGAPDAMFSISGFTVNILPVLMTLINLVSSAIYTKGLSTRSKVQLYVMAGLFLVLLYDSPAGLVFYWTLNNLFSLVKNIFYKLKNPRFVLCLLSSLTGAAALITLFLHPMDSPRKQLILIIVLLLLQLPLIIYFLMKKFPKKKITSDVGADNSLFWISAALMAILTGVLIPSAVVRSSPEEFIDLCTLKNPLWFILNSALVASGCFVVWFGIFYKLAGSSGKHLITGFMSLLCAVSLTDYLFFGRNFGTLSPGLAYDNEPLVSASMQLLNISVLIVIVSVVLILFIKKKNFIKSAFTVICAALILMSSLNIIPASSVLRSKIQELQQQNQSDPVIPLSKNGKNVIVLMLDRAIGSYIPYCMNEKPELLEQFSGFTYYPNTISFGGHTNLGSPGLYGGYEYIPSEMNKRDTESLASKHNEAMKLMPVIFDESDFKVTVCNPTFAGYEWIPDLSIYDEYPDIKAYNTLNITFNLESILNRNFFCYSLFKISPSLIQPTLYSNGNYCNVDSLSPQARKNPHQAEGTSGRFMKNYQVLQNLPDMTEISSEDENTFLMMCNETTHEPMLLKEPEYIPANVVDNSEYDAAHADRFQINGRVLKMETANQVIHYQSNMATLLQLGKWFDYLKEMDVYNNTRIILVADHGRNLDQYYDIFHAEGIDTDLMYYNPLLMIKDFNAEKFTTDNSFMTNADTPTLAFKDLIDKPVNPFTGKTVNNDPKFEGEQYISTSNQWEITVNNGNTFLPDGWISVHDNIFESGNWKLIKANTD